MNLLVTHTHLASATRWAEELSRLLPSATVKIWPEVDANWADYAIGWSPTAELFQSQGTLKGFFSAAAGIDHLLKNPALPALLPLIRLEDAGMGLQMAEYCLLEVGKHYHQRQAYYAQQQQSTWQVLKNAKRSDFTVGIFGAGILAKEIVKGLNYFNYRTQTFSRSSEQSLEDFLRRSSVLILCAPLTPDTSDFFDRTRLTLLPKGAYLINVARGGLVVDADLIALLDEQHLSGATLDVFREEPLPTHHAFWQHPKIRITPHVSALTLIGPSAKQVSDKLVRLAMNQPVTGLIDRLKGY
jgi:glyoxylate/hydroxypyruvate reductase